MKKLVLQCMILSGLTVGGISGADAQSGSNKSLMQRLSHEKAIMQHGFAAAKKRYIQKKKLTRQELRYYNAAMKRLGGLAALLAAIGIGAGVRYKGRQDAEARAEGVRRMHAASMRGVRYDIERLLDEIKAGSADVDGGDDLGHTALMLAAIYGFTDLIDQLIDVGADVNVQSEGDGSTALILAAQNGHSDVVKQLLVAGAYTHLEQLPEGTALQAAAWNGHRDIVKILLDAGGADREEAASAAEFEGRYPEIARMIREFTPIRKIKSAAKRG